jgi:peptidoglycan/xylan/chitin deacetylase (PgdA/CDA1 family)
MDDLLKEDDLIFCIHTKDKHLVGEISVLFSSEIIYGDFSSREFIKNVKKISDRKRGCLVFSRNDQVGKRELIGYFGKELQHGYTTLGGAPECSIRAQQSISLDAIKRILKGDVASYKYSSDAWRCISETSRFEIKSKIKTTSPVKTASLIFDSEQLCEIESGLPNVLNFLSDNSIQATFFLTGLMEMAFSGLSNKIKGLGHEVGNHGLYHELPSSDNDVTFENNFITSGKILGLQSGGANLIARMPQIDSLFRMELKYILHPMHSYWNLFGYRQTTDRLGVIRGKNKTVYTVPVNLETYGQPYTLIKNNIDYVVNKDLDHINILLHPFRDGCGDPYLALGCLVDRVKKSGYEFITVTDWVDSKKHNAVNINEQKWHTLYGVSTKVECQIFNRHFINNFLLGNYLRIYRKLFKRTLF